MDDITNERIQENIPKTLPEILKDVEVKLSMVKGEDAPKDDTRNLVEIANSVRSKLNNLILVDKLGKPKKFKLKNKSKLGTMYKKNKLLVFILGLNGSLTTRIMEIYNGCIVLDGVPRPITEFQVFMYEGKFPSIIVPAWSLEPIGTQKYYEEFPQGINIADAVKIIYGYSKSNEVSAKSSIDPKYVVFGLIGVIVVIYLFMGGTK